MLKLTLGSLFRLVAIAAIGIAVANWWPRATPASSDGVVAWYHGAYWGRAYYLVTKADYFRCNCRASVTDLPQFAKLTGTYPDGSIREESETWIEGHQDGCTIVRTKVRNGTYYAPNGTEVGRVVNGNGNIKLCRPNGSPAREIFLDDSLVTREKIWWSNGNLQSDREFKNGRLHGECKDFYFNGALRSMATYENNTCVKLQYFDLNGNESANADPLAPVGTY